MQLLPRGSELYQCELEQEIEVPDSNLIVVLVYETPKEMELVAVFHPWWE
jgi:hypothetical protein